MTRFRFAAALLLLASPSTSALAQDAPPDSVTGTGTLTVVLTGFESDEGTAVVRLDSSEATFIRGEDFFRVASVAVEGGQTEVTFADVPYGPYALSAFHDQNANEQLDTGAFGIPLEAYGFSNGARGRFGPPSYKESAFAFTPDSTTVTITVK